MGNMTFTARAAIAMVFALMALPGSGQAGGHDPAPPEVGATVPRLEDLGRRADEILDRLTLRMGPMVERLRDLVDDLDAYEAPEILPNGVIILRRKRTAPALPPEETQTGRAPGLDL